MPIFIYERPCRSNRTPAANELTTSSRRGQSPKSTAPTACKVVRPALRAANTPKIRRRHGQASYGAAECRLCLGIVLPLGAIFQSIYRKSGNAGFKVGIGLVAQFGASGTVEQRHLHDRTDNQNSLLRNTDRHHHVVEHLYQNAHGIGKCCGARQARRPRKAPRKVCVSSRSAVAQRAARHQTSGNYYLNLNRHNQQQQCRHQQNARDVTRCVDGMGTVIIQNGTHKKPITLAPRTRLS